MASVEKQIPVSLVPRDGGLLLRRSQLAEFMRTVAPLAGFQLDAPDFIGSQQNGPSLYIRRWQISVPTTIGIALELQAKWGAANACAVGIHEGVAMTVRENEAVYTGGSITTTTTAAGNIIAYGPGDTPDSCAEQTITDDFNPGTAYGSFVENLPPVFSGPIEASAIFDAAAAAVDNDGPPDEHAPVEWMSDGPPSLFEGAELGYFIQDEVSATVYRFRYRWKVTGDYDLRLNWTEGGTDRETDIAAGGESSWYDDTLPGVAGIDNRSVLTPTAVTVL